MGGPNGPINSSVTEALAEVNSPRSDQGIGLHTPFAATLGFPRSEEAAIAGAAATAAAGGPAAGGAAAGPGATPAVAATAAGAEVGGVAAAPTGMVTAMPATDAA